MVKIWAYGYIRKGGPMHHNYDLGDPIRKVRMKGLDMYTYGDFPRAVKGTGSIIAEMYDVDDDTFESMNGIEIGAGYKPVKANGAVIWIYQHIDRLKDMEKIEHGDWIRWDKENHRRYY